MKRRDFLGKLLKIGTGVAATAVAVPVMAKMKGREKPEQTFTIENDFVQPTGNKSLYYIKKDSPLNQELMKALGDHYLPVEKFGCYYGVFNQFLPFKDKYTIDDFRQLIMFLDDRRKHFDYFCDATYRGLDLGLLQLFKDEKNGYYKLQLFQAFKHGQYGPKD